MLCSNETARVRAAAWMLALASAGAGGEVRAQPAPPPAPKDKPDEEVSAQEQKEIEEALAADAATKNKEEAKPSSAPSGGGLAAFLPDISVILDIAAAYFSDHEPLQTGDHDPTVTGFNLQQLELSFNKSVDPYLRFDSNIVFSLDGVEIEEAYATTLTMPWGLQARAGEFLTRFGRLNATHPHSWDFVDQPFFFGKVFGADNNRGLGAELSWLTPLPWYVEVVGSTTTAFDAGANRSFYGDEDQGIHSPLDFENMLAVKQFFDLGPDWSLLVGASAANGPNPTGRDTRTDIYGADVYLKFRPITEQSFTVVSLQAEALYRRRQVPLDVLQDAGGYAQLFWRFAQRWGIAGRYEYGTATYDSGGEVAVDPLDPDQTTDRHRVSHNVTYWPTEFSRLRFQSSIDIPGWRPRPIFAAFIAAEVVVGSHGAHAF